MSAKVSVLHNAYGEKRHSETFYQNPPIFSAPAPPNLRALGRRISREMLPTTCLPKSEVVAKLVLDCKTCIVLLKTSLYHAKKYDRRVKLSKLLKWGQAGKSWPCVTLPRLPHPSLEIKQ